MVERSGTGGDSEYVFVQTVVVRSVRQSGWLERTMGRGRLQDLPRLGVAQPVPRVGGHEERAAAGATPALMHRFVKGQNVDLWINALALGTLGAFLLSLYLVH